jgi:TonB-linked SusC/RagA family outer membrane protein
MQTNAICNPLPVQIEQLSGRWLLLKILLLMRTTAILLLAGFVQVSAHGFGQEKITLSERDATLQKTFEDIQKQTSYTIWYKDSLLLKTSPVTIELKKASLEETLKLCLRGQPVGYSILGKDVVIERKKVNDPAGIIDVKGKVADEKGDPVSGVTVTIKGTTRATVTDEKGEFILKGLDANATLVFTSINMENLDVAVNGKSFLFVNLKTKIIGLLDVIVNKGYYRTSQLLNTGDVSRVDAKDIEKQPVSDPILALEGRVPGLFIISGSGIPGSSSTIQFRGQNSIANGNNPLYIIDGIPFTSNSLTSSTWGGGALLQMSPFNSLNPADIETIEVLKDADATAIYGSRGANGVILITTKKGEVGKPKFDMNVYVGMGEVAHMMDLLNTQQYLEMRHEAFYNDGQTPGTSNTDYDLLAWDTTRYTNWQKVFIGGTAQITNTSASISGGNSSTQFLISGTYNKSTTVFPGNYSDLKGSAHLNLTNSSTDKRFHLQLSAGYLNDNSNLPTNDLTYNIRNAPDAPAIYDANGNLNWQPLNGSSTWNNPLAATLRNAKSVIGNLSGNLFLSFQILSGLVIKSTLGYNKIQMDQSITSPLSSYLPEYSDYSFLRSNNTANNSIGSWNFEPQLNYQKKLWNGQLEVLIGITFQESIQNTIAQSASGFSSDALIEDIAAAPNFLVVSSSNADYRYNAIFGRIGYNWEDKYLVNLTGRRDGSSRFGPGEQFGNFGALGAGWIFSKEKFIQNNRSFLSLGKLRASYGTTGNDQIGDYKYLSTYSSYQYPYQGLSGLYPTQLTNPNYGWELVKKLEAGLDLGFLKDRILFSGSYYYNRTGNQLVGYSLPAITGFSSVQANLPATVQNSGAEFTLNSINIKGKNFKWTTALNLTIPRNKLIAYPNLASSGYAYTYVVGQSLFTQELYHYTGVNPQTGVYTFDTKNSNGIPSYPNDLHDIKKIAPDFYGGFTNSFIYKNWELDIFFQFVKQTGYNYLSWFGGPAGQFGGFNGVDGNQPTEVLSRWQKPGDKTNVEEFTQNYGSSAAQAYFNSSQLGDNSISDASFIRLKNLSLSYQLPAICQEKMHFQSCKIYLHCQNLFTFTRYIGLDPEVTSMALPPLRIITAGIQLIF